MKRHELIFAALVECKEKKGREIFKKLLNILFFKNPLDLNQGDFIKLETEFICD